MYVYRTSIFEQRITKHEQLCSKIERLCQEFETMDLDEIYSRFKALHSYLKRKEGNFRIIAKVLKINQEYILCLLKVFSRGEPAYKRFLEASKYDLQLFQKAELKSDLVRWLEEKKKGFSVSPSSLETLPEEWRFCLERPDWQNDDNDIIIHETESWCEKFKHHDIKIKAGVFRQLIEELVNNFGEIGTETNYFQIRFYSNDQHYILFQNIVTKDDIPQQILLLIAPFVEYPTPEIIQKLLGLVKKSENQCAWWVDQDCLTLENLITHTQRSYPAYLILEENFWLRIQNGEQVNLALSQEEKELLHTVSTKKSLPLFLHGRAGSGKSTMLFYLFAYYCHRHLALCQAKNQDLSTPPHPLFLTYSKNLSEYAKERVQSLLRYHHHFIEETSKLEKIYSLGSFFQSFRSFLLKLLPASEQHNFSDAKYVSFHLFHQQCKKKNPRLSPEKCWLVIQNFIKGYKLEEEDSYLEDEQEYCKIPQKEQKVSVAEFIEIRDRVWSWYARYTQDNSLWDDRDLIRFILSRKYYKSQYTVIFCDEAQDFTRLELKLIMRLSIFSRYNLAQEPILSLPFAFAGDPLQTLNPTGFRWSGFKAAFHEEILSALMLGRTPYLRIELKQLSYNYRSVAPIVKVNNLIQFWRKMLCNLSSIEPQQARKEQSFTPQIFIINNNDCNYSLSSQDILDIIKDTIILIPCDEGEEREFMYNDDLLHHLLETELTSQETPWNILSAITAKGLEFKQVILYKFGQRCPENLWQEHQKSAEEVKYFLNKLYVAASRPTEKLFVIDCPMGENKLWRNLNNQELLEKKLSQIEDLVQREKWQSNIQTIGPGISLEYIKNDDLEANALSFEKVGINTENPELIKRAIAAYKKSNNIHKVNFCSAWMLRFDRKFIEAGKLFLLLDYFLEAAECFWQGSDWHKLRQLLLDYAQDQQSNSCLNQFHLLLPLVDFMATIREANNKLKIKEITQQLLKLRDFLLVEYQKKLFTEEYHTQSWQTGLMFYLQVIRQISLKSDVFPAEEWLGFIDTLRYWFESHNREIDLLIAKCWYLGQDYHQAIKSWENLDNWAKIIPPEDITYYYLAKAKVATLPNGLAYLAIAKQYHIIINQWIQTGKSLDVAWLKYVGLSFAETNHLAQALTISCYLNDLAQIQAYWHRFIQTSSSFPIKYLRKLTQFYLAKQHWQAAILLAEEHLNLKDFKYYFIYRIAFSSLEPSQLTQRVGQRYQNFMINHILINNQWQKYFSAPHLGIVLEKIGFLNYTLSFYLQYANSSKKKLRDFCRVRWLAIKQRQLEYFSKLNNFTQVNQTRTELSLQAANWNLTPQSISMKIPIIVKKGVLSLARGNSWANLASSETTYPMDAICKIKGLHKRIVVKNIAQGVQQFQLHDLIVKIIVAAKKIVLIDLSSNHKIYLDIKHGRIRAGSTTIFVSKKQSIDLQEFQGKYQGTLWFHPTPRLELKSKAYSEKITIEF